MHTDQARVTLSVVPGPPASRPAATASTIRACDPRRRMRRSRLAVPLGRRLVEAGERQPPGLAVVGHVGVR